MTWSFVIEREYPSQNRAAHNHSIVASHRYRKERREWAFLLIVAARGVGIPLVKKGEHEPRRRVELTRLWGKGQRAIDRNNLWGGSKMIVDMMCPPRVFRRRARKDGPIMSIPRPGASLIIDDADQWCDLHCEQEAAHSGIPSTRVAISDIGPWCPSCRRRGGGCHAECPGPPEAL